MWWGSSWSSGQEGPLSWEHTRNSHHCAQLTRHTSVNIDSSLNPPETCQYTFLKKPAHRSWLFTPAPHPLDTHFVTTTSCSGNKRCTPQFPPSDPLSDKSVLSELSSFPHLPLSESQQDLGWSPEIRKGSDLSQILFLEPVLLCITRTWWCLRSEWVPRRDLSPSCPYQEWLGVRRVICRGKCSSW